MLMFDNSRGQLSRYIFFNFHAEIPEVVVPSKYISICFHVLRIRNSEAGVSWYSGSVSTHGDAFLGKFVGNVLILEKVIFPI